VLPNKATVTSWQPTSAKLGQLKISYYIDTSIGNCIPDYGLVTNLIQNEAEMEINTPFQSFVNSGGKKNAMPMLVFCLGTFSFMNFISCGWLNCLRLFLCLISLREGHRDGWMKTPAFMGKLIAF
jgi:hypothetical protein